MKYSRPFAVAVFLFTVVGCGGGGGDKAKDAGPDGPKLPACSDGIDNDGDGKIDYPNDPGCVVAQQDDESDDCPDGPMCPQCANGVDDDANGKTDFPDDPGCTSAGDFDEYTLNPVACGANIMIKQIPINGIVSDGMLDSAQVYPNVSPCGGGDANGIAVVAYELHLTEPKVIVASTIGSAIDTVLDIRGAACSASTSELACNDNDTGLQSKVVYSAQPGTYYILVESKTNASGNFMLNVQQFAGEGEMCTDTSECGPGLLCRIPHGSTTMSCEKPVCSDGRDDDGDGKIDYPNDPGCDSADDADEMDDCPSGPNCPACGNGIDDDGDGQTDYPNDTACTSANGASEAACPNDMDNFGSINGPTATGDLTGGHKDLTFTCSLHPSGNDASWILELPVAVSSLTVDTEGSTVSDTQIELWSGTCTTALGCDDDSGTGNLSTLTVTNLSAGTYAISVAAYSASGAGPVTVNVHGSLPQGASCEQTLNGALACEAGTSCGGTMGSRTCLPNACRDGLDNDGDGKADYPTDPGCSNPNDNDETDDCPTGPNCPACSNGSDDDGDGATDYPADTSCLAASSASEASCPVETDALGTVTMPTMTADLATYMHNLTLSCQSNTGNDAVFTLHLDVPVTSITFDTEGSTATDTVLQIDDDNCTTSLGCDDDTGTGNLSTKTLTNLPAGAYSVIVAGYSTGNNTVVHLNTHGTITAGASCEGALATAGVLTCDADYTCSGTAGSRTCNPAQCNDGIDNDGDGKTDFPLDPGCTSAADDDETDPATLPACSNGSDDDGDGTTDFPADVGCSAPSSTSEVFCPAETDALVMITAPTTNVDLTNTSHTLTFACQTSTGHDLVLGLSLPVNVASLTLDTEGSTVSDTAIELADPQCSASIQCDDDSGTGFLSSLTRTNVAAGNYAVAIAGYSSSNNGQAKVNVHGTLANGTRCDSALFTAGVLTCASGLTCSGAPATCH